MADPQCKELPYWSQSDAIQTEALTMALLQANIVAKRVCVVGTLPSQAVLCFRALSAILHNFIEL